MTASALTPKSTSKKKKPIAPKKPATPRKKPIAKRSVIVGVLWCVVAFVTGSIGGIWVAKGIKIDAGQQDVLSDAYQADRISQVAILRELAQQPFDGSTSEGLEAGVKWFNANRFRDRPSIFEPYSDAVSEAIQQNAEDKLADALEPKK